VANWDPREGGIYWEDHTTGARDNEKSVVSNAPAALLGVDLYRLTGGRTYLQWSERIVTWLDDHLVDHTTGLYDDSLHDDGERMVRSRAVYTYDQGIMIGVLAALSEVDPEQYPVEAAVSLAQRSMADFGSRPGSYGQPGFDVIFAENLLSLSRLDHNHSFDAAARRAVQLARRSEPKGNDLLTYSSDAALQALSTLPSADAGRLYFALPSSRPLGLSFDRGVARAR